MRIIALMVFMFLVGLSIHIALNLERHEWVFEYFDGLQPIEVEDEPEHRRQLPNPRRQSSQENEVWEEIKDVLF